MVAAWEMEDKVIVCILHTETTSIPWALGLRRLKVPGPFQDPIPLCGMPYDQGRNTGAMRAIEFGADYLFFLDSDVVPPPDAIARLIAHRKPIISGVYHRRSSPHGWPVMMKGGNWVRKYPKGKVIEVDVVGAGCLLIETNVLKDMKPIDPIRGKHWFDWRVDVPKESFVNTGNTPGLSEDYSFCFHARQTMGIKILVDTSIQCRHLGLGEAIEDGMIPAGA